MTKRFVCNNVLSSDIDTVSSKASFDDDFDRGLSPTGLGRCLHQRLLRLARPVVRSAVAMGLVALVGCGGARTPRASTTTSTGGESPAGAASDLANASLPNVCMGGDARVQLANGAATYDSELDEGMEGELELEVLGARDLDDDGTLEHLAMIRCMPGGSGIFDSIVAFHATAAGFAVVASIAGGDRADGGLDGARIEGTSVIVGRYSGSEEGVCCPTEVTDETWQLVNGAFVRISAGETRPLSPE